MHKSGSTLLALSLVFTPVLVSGQERDTLRADSTRTFEVEGVMVRVARPILTAGGSSAVRISLDSMPNLPAPTMEEVLRAMPLIQIRTNSRGEAQPALRGSEDRQMAILMDGVPLTLGWDHRTDLSIIPLTAATGVTLVRGLSSVLYGPNTLGGVIEVDVGATDERTHSMDPLILGVSLNETGGTNVSVTAGALSEGAFSQWVFRAGIGFQDRNGFPVPADADDDPQLRPRFVSDGDLRLNSDVRRYDGFVSARYRNDDGRWISLSSSAYTLERGVPPEAHQDDPRLWRYPLQRRLVTAVSGGTGHKETAWGEGDLEFSLGYDGGRTEIDAFASEAYQSVVEEEDADDRTLTARILGEHTLGEVGDVRASATWADISHAEVLTPGGANDYRQRLWSVGLETEWRLGSSTSRLNVGAALDGADTPESGDKPPVGSLTDYAARLGLSTLVTDGFLLHGGLSRRARFPSLRELYSGALGRFVPNPGLRPEVLLGSEAGFTVTAEEIELQAVLFHHRLTDGIIRSSVTDDQGNRKFKRINQDEVRGTGIEFLADGTLGRATLSGDVTLQSVRGFDADGTEVDLEYEPSVMGKAGFILPVASEVELSADFRYVGEQRCENPETGGLQPLSSTSLVDVGLRRVFGLGDGGSMRRVDASVRVDNALGQVAFDQCGLPQPGRTFRIQFKLW